MILPPSTPLLAIKPVAAAAVAAAVEAAAAWEVGGHKLLEMMAVKEAVKAAEEEVATITQYSLFDLNVFFCTSAKSYPELRIRRVLD